MILLQAEMAGSYYLIQIIKFVGLAVLVFAGIYIIGTTIRKINERKDDISKPE
jgi:threonine/homoserine/homoserine lactone efflux protein